VAEISGDQAFRSAGNCCLKKGLVIRIGKSIRQRTCGHQHAIGLNLFPQTCALQRLAEMPILRGLPDLLPPTAAVTIYIERGEQ
jgi:hypothetical protein